MNAPHAADALGPIEAEQRRASDPLASAWVSANAGSGKTYVLTQRVIRLLLAGTDPGRVLCLSFTKAAAANMANKVFGELSRWAVVPEDSLRALTLKLQGDVLPRKDTDRARRLFARAMETPGGLKIQTIHALCERLLRQFPFEANVAASFEVLDDRRAAEILADIKARVLTMAAEAPRSRLGQALDVIVALAAEQAFGDLVDETVAKRHAVAAWLGAAGSLDAAIARLRAAMGLRDGDDGAAVAAEILASTLDAMNWRRIAEVLLAGSANDVKQARRILAWMEGKRLDAYLSIFLAPSTGTLRKDLCTRTLARAHPDIDSALSRERERIETLLEKRKAALLADATQALLTIVYMILAEFEEEKRARGLLDYDDLVLRARRLLADGEDAWVLYKLDGGIDHVLVDEAQDTNPHQWSVIEAITREFFAGDSARGDAQRSVFAVGDEKQSIFSFQGAEPARFEAMRRHFRAQARGARRGFEDVSLRYSFRSTQDVLSAVDRVFADPAARRGLTADGSWHDHIATRRSEPGLVEIWPTFRPAEERDETAWDAPFDTVTETSPAVRLARRIARTIASWTEPGSDERLASGKRITPGGVLILVRSRNAVFEALIRALRGANVPVAGADRLSLMDHIAVQDLVALAEFVLMPEDDLTLAALLKSPLLGLDEESLFALCHGRRGTLWRALQDGAAFDARFRDAYERLADWRRRADFVRPYEFFAGVLGADEGRKRIFARLGHEAADALDELLNLALAYEAAGTPSLQGFLAYLKAARVEVKRDLDFERDEVRVMTVHNAKGLEADVVFLADCCTAPSARHDPKLVPLKDADGVAPLVWRRGAASEQPACVATARAAHRAAELSEHRRLLYVAMTRAKDRLYVCGVEGRKGRPEGNWYDMIRAGLAPDLVERPGPDGAPSAWRWSLDAAAAVAPASPADEAAASVAALPAWIRTPARPERAPRALAPSALTDAANPFHARDRLEALADPARAAALRRGSLVHRLLQALPEIDVTARRETARRFIALRAAELGEAEREALLAEVMAVLEHPGFAPVFSPGSRAEAPIAGRISVRGETVPVSGRVDRLAVTSDSVFIADFKTDREPPAEPEDVPAAYVAQLAAYRTVLAALYPGHAVRAALLWTATPSLMPLPGRLLDRALRG